MPYCGVAYRYRMLFAYVNSNDYTNKMHGPVQWNFLHLLLRCHDDQSNWTLTSRHPADCCDSSASPSCFLILVTLHKL